MKSQRITKLIELHLLATINVHLIVAIHLTEMTYPGAIPLLKYPTEVSTVLISYPAKQKIHAVIIAQFNTTVTHPHLKPVNYKPAVNQTSPLVQLQIKCLGIRVVFHVKIF